MLASSKAGQGRGGNGEGGRQKGNFSPDKVIVQTVGGGGGGGGRERLADQTGCVLIGTSQGRRVFSTATGLWRSGILEGRERLGGVGRKVGGGGVAWLAKQRREWRGNKREGHDVVATCWGGGGGNCGVGRDDC